MQCNESLVLEFLLSLHRKNLSYSALNTARSALSTFILSDDKGIGNSMLVNRFMRGIFLRKPPSARYVEVWDVNVVLSYLKTLYPLCDLSLENLTLKLTMLICLVSAQRAQTLSFLKLSCMRECKDSFVFIFKDHLKQSSVSNSNPTLVLKAFPRDPSICVFNSLKEYLQRTSEIRKDDELFISYIKPHRSVHKETISRWIKRVLSASGIDTSKYKAHSTRAASSSAAVRSNLRLRDLMQAAGWKNASTFAKFYNKNIESDSNIGSALLNDFSNSN